MWQPRLPRADLPRVRARQRHLDGGSAVDGRRRADDQRSEGDRRAASAGPAPAGDHVDRPVPDRPLQPSTRVTACSTSGPPGSPADGIDTVDITSSVAAQQSCRRSWRRPASARHLRPRGRRVGDLHPDVHVHPQRRPRRGTRRTTCAGSATTGRSTRPATIALPRGPPMTLHVTVNPADAGRPLGDPPAGRSGLAGRRLPDDEHRRRRGPSRRRLLRDEVRVARPGQFKHLLLPRPGGHARLQGRHDRGGAAGPGAIRFLRWQPWGLALTRTRSPTATTARRAAAGRGARPAGRYEPARVSGRSPSTRGDSDAVNAPYTLTASMLGATVSPNPDVIPSATIGMPVARSYTSRTCSGRSPAGPSARRSGAPRASADDREPRDADVRRRGSGGNDAAAGHDRQPVGSGRRPRSVRAQLPDGTAAGRSKPTATPRSR